MKPIEGIPGGNSRYSIDLIEEICRGLKLDPRREPSSVMEAFGRKNLIENKGISEILPKILEELVIFETELDLAGMTPESWTLPD